VVGNRARGSGLGNDKNRKRSKRCGGRHKNQGTLNSYEKGNDARGTRELIRGWGFWIGLREAISKERRKQKKFAQLKKTRSGEGIMYLEKHFQEGSGI